jgi:uncharacterized protein (TIGR00297 family)
MALNIPRILAGLVLSTLIGGVAYNRGTLTRSGWAGAILTGTLTFGFGGWTWGITLIVFFITSSLLSRLRQTYKQRLAGEKFEKSSRRDLLQALANGGAGGVCALLYALSGESVALLAVFAGLMATVTADTWATELGVLNRRPPRLITTLRAVAPGTSGGITLLGVLASSAGALVIGLTMLILSLLERQVVLLWLVPAALVGGVIGSLSDSLLGATVQAIYRTSAGEETERAHDHSGTAHQHMRGRRWMNNDAVNFISSLIGGLCTLGVWLLVGR